MWALGTALATTSGALAQPDEATARPSVKFSEHLIADGYAYPYGIGAGDLDGDDDLDIAATTWRTPGRVLWCENRDGAGTRWVTHILKQGWRSANQIVIGDLNGDSRPDLAAAAKRGTSELRWWRNEGRPSQQTRQTGR